MSSLFNHIILAKYPTSTTPKCILKTTSLQFPCLIKTRSNIEAQRKQKYIFSISCSSSVPVQTESTASWIENYIPRSARPYADLLRLHNITYLITSPSLWSIAFTAEPRKFADAKMLALFTVIGFVYRAIILTINDILDCKVDAKVTRTKHRPLASGELTLFPGLCFLGFQMLIWGGLLFQVNHLSRKLSFIALVLGFIYPLMKRVTFWPQAFLGVMISSFSLCGWPAVKGSVDIHILLPLCTSVFFETMFFETIYSHQDKVDDAKVGVKSPALLLGDSTKVWISGFAAACVSALALTGLNASIGWPYYAFLAASASQLAWHIWSVDLDSPEDCYRKFQSNLYFGIIILGGILFGRLYQ